MSVRFGGYIKQVAMRIKKKTVPFNMDPSQKVQESWQFEITDETVILNTINFVHYITDTELKSITMNHSNVIYKLLL
jgi:hypothetical protein